MTYSGLYNIPITQSLGGALPISKTATLAAVQLASYLLLCIFMLIHVSNVDIAKPLLKSRNNPLGDL